MIDLTIPKGAIFSEDRKYRYALWRVWSLNRKPLMVIGLNPSTANGISDDPTISRLMARAYADFGALLMANLYAYVSTDPQVLLWNDNTIGELTDYYLSEMVNLSERQLCGWGSFKPVTKRCSQVMAMLREPYCLGVNQDGQPKHPLYISYKTQMIRYTKEAKV